MTLLQLTDQPLNETAKNMIMGLRSCFKDDFSIFVGNNSDNKAQWPQGSIDHEKPAIFPWLKRKLIKEILNQIKPNEPIVLTDWFSPLFFSPNQLRNTRFFHLISELPTSTIKQGLGNAYKKRASLLTIMAASNTIKQSLEQFSEEIIVAYPPFLEQFDERITQTKSSFIVGLMESLEPNQGIEVLIEALHRNLELLPQAQLILVGDGSEKKRLLWLINRLNLRRRVQIVSDQQHGYRFLNNFDVFVAPSPNPVGWNPSIIMALAKGLPVIASKVGSHQEIIEHGKSGLLFESGNSHMLSQLLINLYNHPDWMEHYKKTGPLMIKDRFSLENFKKELDRATHDSHNAPNA